MAGRMGLWQTESSCGGFPFEDHQVYRPCRSAGLAAGTASSATRDIYPDPAQAKADLAAALKTAAATHKRILLDFGGNWCGDCQVLDIYFHDPANRPILEANFVLVHVNIGMMDANLDLAKKYQSPARQGRARTGRPQREGQAALQPEKRRVRSHAPHGVLRRHQLSGAMEARTARLLRHGGELLAFLPFALVATTGAPGLDFETWDATAFNHNSRNHAL